MLNRRQFLKLIIQGAVLGNFINLISPELEKALAQGEIRKLPIIMIETGTCTGDSISLNNIWTPTFSDIFNNITEWRYDWTLSQGQGDLLHQVILDTEESNTDFVLLVQGSIVQQDKGNYNHVALENGKLITGVDMVRRLGLKAKYVVAIGSCATYGGPASGYPNPTNSTGVQNILPERQVINVSGCPAHPDWIMGTLLHLALYGEPELEKFGRPIMFYGETIHNNCPRRRYYDQGIFATDVGQKECLYRVGCKGPVTYADCPIRQWNDRFNWPIGCNSPCIGCTEPGYPDLMEPFTNHFPDIPFPGGSRATTDRVGRGILGLAGLGIGSYFLASLYKGRIHRTMISSTLKKKGKLKIRKVEKPRTYYPKNNPDANNSNN